MRDKSVGVIFSIDNGEIIRIDKEASGNGIRALVIVGNIILYRASDFAETDISKVAKEVIDKLMLIGYVLYECKDFNIYNGISTLDGYQPKEFIHKYKVQVENY